MSVETQSPVPFPKEFMAQAGYEDVDDLNLRYYDPERDFTTVNGWWVNHRGDMLPAAALPPLGVIVEKGCEPVAALWCYESIGIAVGFLEFPIAVPGLAMAEAGRVMAFAAAGCMFLAGKRFEPQGVYSFFRVLTPYAGIARFLKKLGFQQEDKPLIPLNLHFT